MNKPLLLVGGVAVVSGIFAGVFWRDLRSERLVIRELRSQLAEARTAAAIPANAAPPVSQSMVSSPTPENLSTSVPAIGRTPMERDSTNRARTPVVLLSVPGVATAGVSEYDLLKDPEYRKAQVLQIRMRLALSNPGLAETVGLSEREATRFFEVMAEDQLKRTEEQAAISAAGEAADTVETPMLLRSPADDPLRVLLGQEKFARYQDYQRSVRPALIQVAGIGSMLTSAGQPLNDSQARGLASSMLAEQQHQLQESAVAVTTERSAVARGMVYIQEEAAKRQDESSRRILESASLVLNAAQLGVLRQQYDREAAERRRHIELARQRERGQR